jgi:hypothetical protein
MAKEFYNDLINYVSKADTSNANALLMKEVGTSLAKNQSDFIELLTSSGVPANDSMSDVELIDAFVKALPKNKTLMISTAYMINNQNRFVSADGTEQISDKGVKVSYKVMYDFFTKDDLNNQEFSNLAADPVSAIAQGVGALANLGTAGIGASQKKKYGATDALSKQQEARNQLIQSALAAKQAEAAAKQKKAESSAKMKKVLVIGGISLLALTTIGFIIYKIKTK